MNCRFIRYVQLLAASLALLAGGTIYMLFRSKKLLGFHLADAVGLGGAIDALRSKVCDVHLSDFVVYCLPDGLWTTAYIFFVDYVLRGVGKRQLMLAVAIIPAIGSVSEIMQFFNMLPGTFDVMDLLCYMVPFVIYALVACIADWQNK